MTALQQEIFDHLLVHSWSSTMREYNITTSSILSEINPKFCINRIPSLCGLPHKILTRLSWSEWAASHILELLIHVVDLTRGPLPKTFSKAVLGFWVRSQVYLVTLHCGFTSERPYDFVYFCVNISLCDFLWRVRLSKFDYGICEICYTNLGGSKLLSQAVTRMTSISTRPPPPVDSLASEYISSLKHTLRFK